MRICRFLGLCVAVFLPLACSSEDDMSGAAGSGGGATQCDEVTDCADPTTTVCDPVSAECVAAQCSDTAGCAKGKTCRTQQEGTTIGACYAECIFKGSPCAGEATCRVAPNDNGGFCWNAGSADEGQSCKSTSVNTGCVPGLICATDQGQSVCRNQCSYWSASPGCPAPQHCAVNSLCFTQTGDSADIGATCSSGVSAGEPCGSDGKAWRGSCASNGTANVCTKTCRVAVSADCPSGKTCKIAAGDNVGLCL